jgi:hypothetical protein
MGGVRRPRADLWSPLRGPRVGFAPPPRPPGPRGGAGGGCGATRASSPAHSGVGPGPPAFLGSRSAGSASMPRGVGPPWSGAVSRVPPRRPALSIPASAPARPRPIAPPPPDRPRCHAAPARPAPRPLPRSAAPPWLARSAVGRASPPAPASPPAGLRLGRGRVRPGPRPPAPLRRGPPAAGLSRYVSLIFHVFTVPEIPYFTGFSARQAR